MFNSTNMMCLSLVFRKKKELISTKLLVTRVSREESHDADSHVLVRHCLTLTLSIVLHQCAMVQ